MKNKIISVGSIGALSLLLFNDLFLKHYFHGIISGKLSDLAGLFLFPFLLTQLLPSLKKRIYFSTAILFVLWKLPLANSFIQFYNHYIPLKIGRVSDYSDYVALIILPLSYFYENRCKPFGCNKSLTRIITSIAIFACFSSNVGTIHAIYRYPYNNFSNKEFYDAISIFYNKYPEYRVPSKYRQFTDHKPNPDPNVNSLLKELYSDSTNFYFFLNRNNKEIILHTSYTSIQNNLNEKFSELIIEKYIESFTIWKNGRNATRLEKKEIMKLFEEEILSKLNIILQEQRKKKVGYQN
jgi:hypothetical protein